MPQATSSRVIHLHLQAPPQPRPGEPCNGCGVCCAAEPCPLGALLSGRRHGACRALQWHAGERRYRCGVVAQPRHFVPWAPAGWVRRLALRWISAASGCDCTLERERTGQD